MLTFINKINFPLKMWLFSRGLICFAMLIIAPLLAAPSDGIQPKFGWDVFNSWDSGWYEAIVKNGYEYANDAQQHNVAFFPLFPLLIRIVMTTGLPFNIAGTLVNNLAFLGALIIFYHWIKKHYELKIAQWSIAVLVWCPFSLFCTVIYTEGLFLFLTASALICFENKQYIWASIFGALSTATRVTGLALIPAFLITSYKEKGAKLAYFSGIFIVVGLLSYLIYCWLKFDEPLAFIKVQKAWHPEQSFWGESWLKMFSQVIFGFVNTKEGSLKDIGYILAVIIVSILAYLLWYFRSNLGNKNSDYGYFFLIFLAWLIGGNPFINTVIVFGGIYLLWRNKNQINLVSLLYAIFSFIIIFSSGRTTSAERYTYAIIPLSLALGIVLHRYPRWGYAAMIFFGLLLAIYSIRFAQHLWVA
jgi:Gpi18-like mannosyltransferase